MAGLRLRFAWDNATRAPLGGGVEGHAAGGAFPADACIRVCVWMSAAMSSGPVPALSSSGRTCLGRVTALLTPLTSWNGRVIRMNSPAAACLAPAGFRFTRSIAAPPRRRPWNLSLRINPNIPPIGDSQVALAAGPEAQVSFRSSSRVGVCSRIQASGSSRPKRHGTATSNPNPEIPPSLGRRHRGHSLTLRWSASSLIISMSSDMVSSSGEHCGGRYQNTTRPSELQRAGSPMLRILSASIQRSVLPGCLGPGPEYREHASSWAEPQGGSGGHPRPTKAAGPLRAGRQREAQLPLQPLQAPRIPGTVNERE